MRIELDTVIDKGTTSAETGQRIVQGYPNVTFRVVTENGPAGGNPILAFRGPREQLQEMVTAGYGPDAWADTVA